MLHLLLSMKTQIVFNNLSLFKKLKKEKSLKEKSFSYFSFLMFNIYCIFVITKGNLLGFFQHQGQ